MPIATQVQTPGTGHGAKEVMNGLKEVEWVAAKDVSAEVGGQANVDYLKRVSYDFSSDTKTIPSDAQLQAGMRATRGDDVYRECQTTISLEERVAKLTGKEAGAFGQSGTMTNQLAIRTHMHQPPHSVIVDYRAHVHKMEAGGIAMFSQATTDQIVPSNGHHLTLEDIIPHLQLGENIHYRPTKLICLENTLAGTIFPQEEIVRISEYARAEGIAMHLDGARIWEVAAAEIEKRGLDSKDEESLRVVLTELLEPFDTASLCLSKGIGAPIGSMIVGPKPFIEKTRWFRKAFGGGVRQSGANAAAADYGLTNHFPRLAYTHKLARKLADGLVGLGCTLICPTETNMVFFDPLPIGLTTEAILARMQDLPIPISFMGGRVVVHHQISPEAVQVFLRTVEEMKGEVEAGKGAELRKEGELLDDSIKKPKASTMRMRAAVGY